MKLLHSLKRYKKNTALIAKNNQISFQELNNYSSNFSKILMPKIFEFEIKL